MTQGVFSGCLWLRCRGLLARWEVGRPGCDGCARGLSTLTCLWSPTCLLLLYWRYLEERHERFWVRKLLGTYLLPTNCSNCHKCKKCWAGQSGSWGGEGQWTWVKAGEWAGTLCRCPVLHLHPCRTPFYSHFLSIIVLFLLEKFLSFSLLHLDVVWSTTWSVISVMCFKTWAWMVCYILRTPALMYH